jgi:hypothetical protein
MAKYYTTARLSASQWETPEGFLVCGGVPITRVGELEYLAHEIPITPDGRGRVIVTRDAADIFDARAIASFEGKPVTIGHQGDINPENWRDHAVGVVQNVRPGRGDEAGKLLADLLITDADAIEAVRSGRLREVSCGYGLEFIETGVGRGRQRNIRGNHVALVEEGRAGPECRIFDEKPKKDFKMKSLKALLRRAADEMPDEDKEKAADEDMDIQAVLKLIMERLDKLEGQAADADPEEKEEEEKKAEDADGEVTDPDKERKAEDRRSVRALDSRLKLIEDGLAKLLESQIEVRYSAQDAARAEVLAPGVAHTADMKKRAVVTAYATEDGKAVIDSLLDGKPLEKVSDFNALFLAASAALQASRRGGLPQAGRAADAFAGAVTPEKLNEINQKFWSGK